MKKIAAVFIFLLLGGALTFFMTDLESDNPRLPASAPSNYESLSACEKQEFLWDKVLTTAYKDLPDYKKFGALQLMSMGMQEIAIKGSLMSDFAPEKWKKYIHRRGALAKVKIVPLNKKYTGVFQGAECALLRLSLTYKVAGKRPVAPGLALKVLRDGAHSANISALVSLEGQEKDFNFFKKPMSNIVPVSGMLGQKLMHYIFSKVSHYPEELVVTDMGALSSQGKAAGKNISPRQLFFVPGKTVSFFSSNEHDVREDFLSIPEGTVIYRLYALSEKHAAFNYADYTPQMAEEFVKESEHIADIVSTSSFIASEFGDDGIFFRHQLRQ